MLKCISENCRAADSKWCNNWQQFFFNLVNVVQDFGDTIPGHGGLMDRFDCQVLMGTFVHVYNSSFVR